MAQSPRGRATPLLDPLVWVVFAPEEGRAGGEAICRRLVGGPPKKTNVWERRRPCGRSSADQGFVAWSRPSMSHNSMRVPHWHFRSARGQSSR